MKLERGKMSKILLVEDDVTLVKMYEKKFVAEGYEVAIGYDGEEGLKKATTEKPDLVVLDILLPKMDGLEVFRKMRSQQETFHTPVLILTNFDKEESIFECFKLGAVDYLIKSEVDLNQVMKKVDELLNNKK